MIAATQRYRPIDFAGVGAAVLSNAEGFVRAFLPDGRREGTEWVARNPQRDDRRLGSFKVNLLTGRWCDFATGDGGGDLVSLAAYLTGLSQRDAAVRIAERLGIDPYIG